MIQSPTSLNISHVLQTIGQVGIDLGEYVADDRAEYQQNSNNYDCYQNKDQSILDKTLAFFFRGEQHG